MASSSDAQKRWELENDVQVLEEDQVYKYDADSQKKMNAAKPWKQDPHYFKHVRVSSIALLKMVMHARSGGTIEVMGVMQGKIDGDTMVVMDAFALPVEGTETRVNAQADSYEYMVNYQELCKQCERPENVIGWYHSHPGYGCWLSGIDVSTQMLNQRFQEPFLAVVIDPTRTISAGKVEIGAFRTYPEGYVPPNEASSEYQSIPIEKIEDFGVHCKQYYPLELSYFKSSTDRVMLDLLWNKYWVNTLGSSPLIANREYTAGQIKDLASKLENVEGQLSTHRRVGGFTDNGKRKDVSQLGKIAKDSTKVAVEQCNGLFSQVLKVLSVSNRDFLFNNPTPPDV